MANCLETTCGVCNLTREQKSHWRGVFSALGVWISYGGRQTVCSFLTNWMPSHSLLGATKLAQHSNQRSGLELSAKLLGFHLHCYICLRWVFLFVLLNLLIQSSCFCNLGSIPLRILCPTPPGSFASQYDTRHELDNQHFCMCYF